LVAHGLLLNFNAIAGGVVQEQLIAAAIDVGDATKGNTFFI
jgi:hypothetical protein